jgi:hypothetical protein
MSYTFERFPNEPIAICTFKQPYDPKADAQGAAEELIKMLASIQGDVYYIADLRNINVSFSDLAVGLAQAFKTPGSPYANPRLKTFTVGSGELVRIGVETTARSQAYGNVQVRLFTSLEDALEQVRVEIAKSA